MQNAVYPIKTMQRYDFFKNFYEKGWWYRKNVYLCNPKRQ